MDIPIIYEDEFLLVIDKPAGTIANRADSVAEETLQDWAEKKYQISLRPELRARANIKYQKEEAFYQRAGIVHRLDKETSGLLIIAKTPAAFLSLQSQFKERTVRKKYITLVHGKVTPSKGEIKASVGRLPWNRERFGVLAGGREAITSYKVMAYYRQDDNFYTLLEVAPTTGRTHQIRIHLKYLGHAVVADRFYAGRKTTKEDIKFCPRLFLHAAYMAFAHPESGETIEIESKLPEDLMKVLNAMNKNA